LHQKIGFRIRIEQQGVLMKTSQRSGAMMQKKTFHMRFFELNVSTCDFKVFTSLESDRKVKHTLNLRNRVVALVKMRPRLKPDYLTNFKAFAQKVKGRDLNLPHDYKFPFAVIYEDQDKLAVLLLWAQCDKTRN